MGTFKDEIIEFYKRDNSIPVFKKLVVRPAWTYNHWTGYRYSDIFNSRY